MNYRIYIISIALLATIPATSCDEGSCTSDENGLVCEGTTSSYSGTAFRTRTPSCGGETILGEDGSVFSREITVDVTQLPDVTTGPIEIEFESCTYIGQRSGEQSITLFPDTDACAESFRFTRVSDDTVEVSILDEDPTAGDGCVISESGELTRLK